MPVRDLVVAGALSATCVLFSAPSALAQAPPTGAPPADESSLVTAPKALAYVPPPSGPVTDAMHVALSAGGQFQTGNTHLYAFTGQGKFDIRRGDDAFAAGLIGNYARTFTLLPAGAAGTPAPPGYWADSADNLQGKVRYDRYLTNNASLYMQVTGTHDTFQALTFRLNVDPGVKVLFVADPTTKLWAEAGYDFQYDLHYTDSLDLERAGAGGLTLDPNGDPYLISQTDTIQSSRLFLGFSQAFNKEVQLSSGLEYLQGFGGSGANPPGTPAGYAVCSTLPMGSTMPCVDPVTISLKSARLNFDVLLAASVGKGFSFGVGYSLKYNGAPLPGKVDTDMSGTFSIIYAYADPAPKPPPPPPLCLPPAPPPPAAAPPTPAPPAAPPAPATIPMPAAPSTMPPPPPAAATMPPSAML